MTPERTRKPTPRQRGGRTACAAELVVDGPLHAPHPVHLRAPVRALRAEAGLGTADPMCEPVLVGSVFPEELGIPSKTGRQNDSAVFDDGALRLLVDVMGPERVMFGTDYPFPLGEQQMGALVRGSERLSGNEKRKILGENAIGFFGLETADRSETASIGN